LPREFFLCAAEAPQHLIRDGMLLAEFVPQSLLFLQI